MSIEQGEKINDSFENASETVTKEQLERLLAVKDPELPSSIKKYIRRLKEADRWDIAMGVRQEEMEKAKKKRGIETREQRARKELDRTIRQILETDDPQLQAEDEVKAIWLLDISGGINQEERIQDLLSILDSKAPELKEFLEGRMFEIREQALKV